MALCLISNRRNSANTDSIRQAKEQSYPWNKQTNGFVVNTPKQITLLFRFSGDSLEAKYFELNRNTGQIYAKASIPENEFVQPVTLVIKATQYDNPDRYTVTTLTVTRDGQVGGGEFWKILSYVRFIPFFVFWFLVKVTKMNIFQIFWIHEFTKKDNFCFVSLHPKSITNYGVLGWDWFPAKNCTYVSNYMEFSLFFMYWAPICETSNTSFRSR